MLTACGYPISENDLIERFCGISDAEMLAIKQALIFAATAQAVREFKIGKILVLKNPLEDRRTLAVAAARRYAREQRRLWQFINENDRSFALVAEAAANVGCPIG